MTVNRRIYEQMIAGAAAGRKRLCLLVDPDKHDIVSLEKSLNIAERSGVDLIFVGGSLLLDNRVSETIRIIRDNSSAAVVLFPGSPSQIDERADAILLLSLISGRNADLLIGRHVEAAPALRKSGLEIIPTGYMLIDGGQPTTASYISNTFPIPAGKSDIAACTALAGEMLGMKLIYLDGGSGAAKPVPPAMISMVKAYTSLPVIVGGGIRSAAELRDAAKAGADIIVVGNAIEQNPELLYYLGEAMITPA